MTNNMAEGISRKSTTNGKLRVFEGATAIVTGGASGIGRALGAELARRGCIVCLADRQLDEVVQAAAEIRASGTDASAAHLDVSDYSAVERLVGEVMNRTGRLDYIFNNAGIAIGGPTHLHNIDDWNRTIAVNLLGVANGLHVAYQAMRKQGFGHIVNTGSTAGLLPAPGAVSYAASKCAVVGLSRALRIEAALNNVRVSVLCPGAVRTPILQSGGKFGKSYVNLSPEQEREMWDRFHPISPDTFARKALSAVARNKAIIVIPSWWKAFWALDRLFPSLTMYMARKSYSELLALVDSQTTQFTGTGVSDTDQPTLSR